MSLAWLSFFVQYGDFVADRTLIAGLLWIDGLILVADRGLICWKRRSQLKYLLLDAQNCLPKCAVIVATTRHTEMVICRDFQLVKQTHNTAAHSMRDSHHQQEHSWAVLYSTIGQARVILQHASSKEHTLHTHRNVFSLEDQLFQRIDRIRRAHSYIDKFAWVAFDTNVQHFDEVCVCVCVRLCPQFDGSRQYVYVPPEKKRQYLFSL